MAQPRASSVEAWGAFATPDAQRKFRKTSWLAPVCIALLCASFGAAARAGQIVADAAHVAGIAAMPPARLLAGRPPPVWP